VACGFVIGTQRCRAGRASVDGLLAAAVVGAVPDQVRRDERNTLALGSAVVGGPAMQPGLRFRVAERLVCRS